MSMIFPENRFALFRIMLQAGSRQSVDKAAMMAFAHTKRD
jgi:hypothetical protein